MPEWKESNYKRLVEIPETSYTLPLSFPAAIVVTQVKDGWKANLVNLDGQVIESLGWHLIYNSAIEAKNCGLIDALYMINRVHQTLHEMREALIPELPQPEGSEE